MLTGTNILEAVNNGVLSITPFDMNNIQPASYDVTLSSLVARTTKGGHLVQPFNTPNSFEYFKTESREIILLHPNEMVLAKTNEYLELPPHMCARLDGKSTLARWGLNVHITAGLIDPGFRGYVTLELKNNSPWFLQLKEGDPIGQFTFYLTDRHWKEVNGEGVNTSYSGRYQDSQGIGLPY